MLRRLRTGAQNFRIFSYEICVASLLKQLYCLWLPTNLLIDSSAPCIAEQQLKRMQTLPSPDGAASHATALTASPYYSGRLCPNHAQSHHALESELERLCL
jgi:hypothetical protein